MNTYKNVSVLIVLISLITACRPNQEDDIAVEIALAVALTQTAVAQEVQQPLVEPTATPTEVVYDLMPLNADECGQLSDTLGQNLGLQGQVAEVDFEDPISQKTGKACQVLFTVTGQEIDNLGVLEIPAKVAMENDGWQEDPQYAAGGAGGVVYGYRKGNAVCRLTLSAEPSDMTLCSSDEPISTCWERLAPEQKVFKVDLICSQGDLPEFAPQVQVIESEMRRIEFGVGEFSQEITQTITPGGVDQFVLNAGAGQRIETTFYPPGVATVVIYGQDGTVLKSDLDNTTTWSGELPSTQDYFIDIRSTVGIETEYTLTISIPPLTPIATTGKIAGSIIYPGDSHPALNIVAYNVESNLWYYIKTGENQGYYEFPGLPPGIYTIAAYSQENMVSGYLTPITVSVGETTQNIDFTSWSASDSSSFPSDPVGW